MTKKPKPPAAAKKAPWPVTLRQVAEKAGVSVSTVSAVINDHPSCYAGAQTRAKVRQAVQDTGYYPNLVSRAVRKRQTKTIGLILPNIHVPITAVWLDVIEQALCRKGFQLFIGHSRNDPAREEALLTDFIGRRVDGLIISPAADRGNPILERIVANRFPLVAMNRPSAYPAVPSVNCDYAGGGALAARHLLALGHRHLGIIRRAPSYHSVQARVDGFHRQVQAAGATVREFPIANTFSAAEAMRGSYEAGRRCLAISGPAPSALFLASDTFAPGVIGAMREAGRRIPEDISLVGFDDIPGAAFFPVPLTTISYPARYLGARAAEMLLARIENGTVSDDSETVPVTLVERSSTAPPRG